jgi:hypothetical protein
MHRNNISEEFYFSIKLFRDLTTTEIAETIAVSGKNMSVEMKSAAIMVVQNREEWIGSNHLN